MSILIRREQGFYRRLMKLSMPIVLQNLITFSLGLIDTFMVSQLGNTEMAAVTAANVPVFLLISIVFGVQSGLGILVSQYWGKGDLKNINRALGVACFLGVGVTAVLAVVFALFPVQVMDLLSNRHDLSLLGAPYLQVIGFSYVFNMLSSLYASAQRSVENSTFGMKLFGFSTVLNTVLNYLLIFGHGGLPALGVQGAAVATQQDFLRLTNRALDMARNHVVDIRKGLCAASPVETEGRSPCAWCDWRASCLFDPNVSPEQVRRPQPMRSDEVLMRLAEGNKEGENA